MEISGTPATPEKCTTLSISCAESVSGLDFSPSHPSETHTHTHTHTLSELPLTPPTGQRCPELHQPFMSSRGHSWAPAGGSLPGLPSEDPIGTCGSLWWTLPQPPFLRDSPHWKERELWGLAWTVDTGAGTVPATCASLCVCARWWPGSTGSFVPTCAIHPLSVSCTSVQRNYMCIRAASIHRLNVAGFGGGV